MVIIELIEKGLQKEWDEWNRKRTSHYPSDISACKRQLYYKWTEEPVSNPVTVGGMLKMKMGTAIHDIIPSLLELAGLESAPEVAVKKTHPRLLHPISGRIDNLFIIPNTNSLGVIEVKTSYGAGVKTLQKTGKPREGDENQLLTYLWLEPIIAKGILIYIGRDNGYRTEFEIERDDEYVEDFLIGKLASLDHMVKTRDVFPDRDYHVVIKDGEIKAKYQKDKVIYKSDWQCLFCQFMDTCWENELKKTRKEIDDG